MRRWLAFVVAVVLAPACGTAIPTSSTKPNQPQELAKNSREVADWLRSNVIPLATTDPTASLDDLEPLRGLIGDARIVSMGEATHGTREFFQMKHRVLRFLVERMGFNAFAIEATWPEANRLNDYVRTGTGDPVTLLSGLYFWTWNTQEVLDMIRWMRSYNAAGGNVGFYGFDMQSPGMAIDNVNRFVATVDPASSAEFTAHLGCLAASANLPNGTWPSKGYDGQTASYRDACNKDLQWVQDTLNARHGAYAVASSQAQWARAEHSARVAIQYEEMMSNRRTRDQAMAENVQWLLDQLPAGSKVMLWAHNGHVATNPNYGGGNSMGNCLRQVYGTSMFVIGFDFARGSFNAVGMSNGQYTALTSHNVGEPNPWSYEDYFLAAAMPLFVLDVRKRTNWVAGPLYQRSIGAVFDDSKPENYWNQAARDPDLYDGIIFVENTTASVLLPMNYPSGF